MVPSSDSDLFHLSSAFLLQLHPDEILRMPQIPMLHCMDFFHPLSFRYMLRILHRYVAYQRNPVPDQLPVQTYSWQVSLHPHFLYVLRFQTTYLLLCLHQQADQVQSLQRHIHGHYVDAEKELHFHDISYSHSCIQSDSHTHVA